MERLSPSPTPLSDAIHILGALEDSYIHQWVQCDACQKVYFIWYPRFFLYRLLIASQSIVGVRFRCSQCEDFDLCSNCHSTGETTRHNEDHSFYWIKYRRSSLPPANGEDDTLLRKFAEGNTCESFYLHYPWLFSAGILEKLILGTEDEEQSRNLLLQLQSHLGEDDLDVALDALIRTLARDEWNWREVHDSAKLFLQLQIVRSEYSGLFYSLYSELKNRAEIQESQQSRSVTTTSMTLKTQLFDDHLDSGATRRCKNVLEEFLAASIGAHLARIKLPTMGPISNIARYTEMLAEKFDVSVNDEHSSLLTVRVAKFACIPRSRGTIEAAGIGQARCGFASSENWQNLVTKCVQWSISQSLQRWQEYDSAYNLLLAGIVSMPNILLFFGSPTLEI
jgi:hypothetical protein